MSEKETTSEADKAVATAGGARTVTASDLCATCRSCETRDKLGVSTCAKSWPGVQSNEGHVVKCPEFLVRWNIELKNVKRAEFASEETDCFSATVYIEGKRQGTVDNDGRGGSNRYDPWELQKKLDDYAKTLPRIDCSYMFDDGRVEFMDSSDEILIGELLEDYLEERDRKRKLKKMEKETWFRVPTQTYEEGMWSVIKQPLNAIMRDRLIAKHGNGVVFYIDQL